jgi:hypothetical protein
MKIQGYGTRTRVGGLIISLSFLIIGCGVGKGADLGLSVDSHGVLIRHGVPYRGIGVNYYDAFLRTLRNSGDHSYEAGFAALGENGIPFARIAASGYNPDDLSLYFSDKEAYLRQLDGVVQSAKQSHVGLIASLFWNIEAVSKAVGEPRSSWGDPSSATRRFMRQYTKDVVSRYADSPAIWGWEFSCELSLPVDLRPGQGIPERALTYDTFRSAALDFAQTVRAIDPQRILLTGNSLPRAAAYHNANGGRPGADTTDQFAHILIRDNPGPFSPLCIHASPAGLDRYFADRRVSYQELLQTCMQIGRAANKPLYLEEFIAIPGRAGALSNMDERGYFSSELAAIENSAVPLASVWVYDRKLVPDKSNLTFDNDRAYMLRMIGEFDKSVHAQN